MVLLFSLTTHAFTAMLSRQHGGEGVYITDTISVACLYFIALPSSYMYCVDVVSRNMGARWPNGLERWLALATGGCGTGSNPTADKFASELWQFRLDRGSTPPCQCLSEETRKVPSIWCLCQGK